LVLERGLKAGFRALSERDDSAARKAFRGVLELEPGHPEARAGLRSAEQSPRHRAAESRHDGFVAGGHEVPTRRPVDHSTLRLETRAAVLEASRRLDLAGAGDPVDLVQRSGAETGGLSGIDLVVLHATSTLTAIDRFAVLATGRESAHFLIDWEGSVYQTLDLSFMARHTGSDALDARSVAIELVTPLVQDSPPLPSHATGVERPMSQRLRVQGQLVRAWGYTEAQMASLASLLGDLARTIPELESQLPGGAATPWSALPPAERAAIRGVVGALHVDPRSIEPGPGFDWPALRRAIE